ncbi:hypothetical protein pb186bvf_006931 [Paramecium bursaria]
MNQRKILILIFLSSSMQKQQYLAFLQTKTSNIIFKKKIQLLQFMSKYKVYAMGLNFMGQLGLGHRKQVKGFVQVPEFNDVKIKQLKAHMTQSYALLEDNQLLQWGWVMDNLTQARTLSFYKRYPTFLSIWQRYSVFGDTIGLRGSYVSPILLNKKLLNYRIDEMSLGGSYILTKMIDGFVFGLGENYKGQLGLGDLKYKFEFTKIPIKENEKIIQTSCGYQHSVLLSESGSVYGTGRSNHHQFYTDKISIIFQLNKTIVDFYQTVQRRTHQNYPFIKVSCGFNHTLYLTEKQLYASGLNIYGQCGVSNLDEYNKIKSMSEVFIDLQEEEKIIDIASGQAHNLILTSNGRIILFGSTMHNQLASPAKYDFEQTGQVQLNIPLQENEKIVKIYANFDRSAVLTSNFINNEKVMEMLQFGEVEMSLSTTFHISQHLQE